MLPVTLCQSCNRVQQVYVTGNLLADIGSQDLDDDGGTILERCRVYLCDGGGCQRRFVELPEYLGKMVDSKDVTDTKESTKTAVKKETAKDKPADTDK